MVVLTNGVVLLTAIIGHVIYIEHIKNVREIFICITSNNERNDKWPQQWHRMDNLVTESRKMFKYNTSVMNETGDTQYKLRMYFFNNSFIETNWSESYIYNCNFCENLCYSSIVIVFIIFIVFTIILVKKKIF